MRSGWKSFSRCGIACDRSRWEYLSDQVLRSICPLVDEANDMTSELRPDANLRSIAYVVTRGDFLRLGSKWNSSGTYTTHQHGTWSLFGYSSFTTLRKRTTASMLRWGGGRGGGLLPLRVPQVLCYWSAQRFRHQLDVMRDLYHRVQMDTVERHGENHCLIALPCSAGSHRQRSELVASSTLWRVAYWMRGVTSRLM